MQARTRETDVSRLDELKPILAKDAGIVLAFLFGSYTRGEQTSQSDIYVALLLSADVPSDKHLDYQLRYTNMISKVLGYDSVDVVVLNSCSPLLAHKVIKGRIQGFCKVATPPPAPFPLRSPFRFASGVYELRGSSTSGAGEKLGDTPKCPRHPADPVFLTWRCQPTLQRPRGGFCSSGCRRLAWSTWSTSSAAT